MKKLIYTVLTGEYDQVSELPVVNPEFDHVCLTDHPDLIESKTWQIRRIDNPEGLSPVRLSRKPKILPFEFFPDYDVAVYLDANLILKDDVQGLIDKYKNADVVVSKHPYRDCIYREEQAVLSQKRDHEENTRPQIDKYKKEGFPENYGLSHCNLIVWRNRESVKSFGWAWWNEVKNHSHRDQLSFDYARWRMRWRSLTVERISQYEKSKYVKKKKHSGAKDYPSTMKSQGIDVVYPLGDKKTWGDNELRFSIRSMVKHFKDLRHIVIVGRKPRWLKNVIHIQVNDDQEYRDANLIKKLIAACNDGYVSDQFIWAADDKFLYEDVSFRELCGWHYGHIEYDNPTEWEKWNIKTRQELEKRGLPGNDYNGAHAFQPVDKKEFLKIIESWDWKKNTYLASNIYNNSTELFNGKDCRDFHEKIYEPLPYGDIIRELDGQYRFTLIGELYKTH